VVFAVDLPDRRGINVQLHGFPLFMPSV
jgi:hypothetical protein